jgi:hydrogenase expression/formation protein HypC
MCIGQPLQVCEALIGSEATHAWCEADGQRECLDMQLIGAQPPGTWVLAFHGSARQVMSREEAAQARAARLALAAALEGDRNIDRFFADLVNREPTLPPHLRPAA